MERTNFILGVKVRPRSETKTCPSLFLFQVLEVIKFRFTNWTDPEESEQLFRSLFRIVSESQFDCPVDEVATELAKSFPVFR
jgi:hypothetical protein